MVREAVSIDLGVDGRGLSQGSIGLSSLLLLVLLLLLLIGSLEEVGAVLLRLQESIAELVGVYKIIHVSGYSRLLALRVEILTYCRSWRIG